MKKSLLVVLSLIVLLLGAYGTAGAEKVQIEYWQYYYESKVKLIDDLIKEFEKANPDIDVVHQTFPYEQFNEKVAASVPAGKGPDILTLYYGWLPKYIDSHFLQPLPRDLFPAAEIEKDFLPMINAVKYNGEYWALPTAVRTLALFYNKKLLAEKGYTEPPKTWDELREMAINLTKRTNRGQLLQEGFAWSVSGQDHHVVREVLLRQWGQQPFDDAHRKVLYNASEGAYDAWRYYVNLVKEDKVGEEGYLDTYRNAFIAGKAAMMIDGSFALGTLNSKVRNFEWGVAELPVKELGGLKSTFGSFWAHGITSKAEGKKLEAAAKFLKFITSEHAMRLWLERVGELPARKELAQDPALLEDPKYGPFIVGLNYAHATFFVDEVRERQAMMDACDKVFLEDMDPNDALDWLTETHQAILDKYWETH